MKKVPLFWLLILTTLNIEAQDASPLIAAEKAFEQTCLEKGIRDGFLAFVDSNAIEFGENGPLNGKKFWSSITAFDGVFTWSPSIAEISVSGDWGYTSGNYEHRQKSLTDIPNQFGQYTTVWQRNSNGQWKYLIDIGNPHPKADLDKRTKIISGVGLADQNANESSFLDIERSFILAFKKDIGDSYLNFCSNIYYLNFSGYALITIKDSAINLMKNHTSDLNYYPDGTKISGGRDMAAVYGTLSSGTKRGNYLRIWRHEKTGWKIALEVIRI
jgi:ketosteroid isomerase-like protein